MDLLLEVENAEAACSHDAVDADARRVGGGREGETVRRRGGGGAELGAKAKRGDEAVRVVQGEDIADGADGTLREQKRGAPPGEGPTQVRKQQNAQGGVAGRRAYWVSFMSADGAQPKHKRTPHHPNQHPPRVPKHPPHQRTSYSFG